MPFSAVSAVSALLGAWALSAPALAGDASPKPPPPPEVALEPLPSGASLRPTGLDGKPHQVHARLLLDHDRVTPGGTVRVGLHLQQDKGWHTYWKSPGGIGLPTDITWKLPDGSQAQPYEYPVPQRFEDEGLISFGYEDQVLLFSEVKLPANLPLGKHTLGADARWLVCETSCIPGEVSLTTEVEVAETASASRFAPTFDHFAAQHPVGEVAGLAVEAAVELSPVRPYDNVRAAFFVPQLAGMGAPKLKGTDPWPVFTPKSDSARWYIEKTEAFPVEGGTLVVMSGQAVAEELPASDALGGLIQVEIDGKLVATEVELPVAWGAPDSAQAKSDSRLFAMIPGAAPAAPAEPPVAPGAPASTASAEPVAAPAGLFSMLAFAFVGGLLLNLMPCVLPVLTLKLFGLVSHGGASPAEQKRSGLAYTAGIVLSFWALAGAVVALQASAGGIGWGFQFQSPLYVAGLATVVFAFGLSMFGVFEVPAFGTDAAAEAGAKGGLTGDFFNGVLATLVATPCTAPFLGPAVGFAFGQPAPIILLFFTVIGLGLAAPFLLVAFVPALFKFMPKPGAWMMTFKQVMGFTLIATTLWMVDILLAQIGAERTVGFLAFLTTVGVASWIFGHWGGLEETRQRQGLAFGAAVLVMLGGGWGFLDLRLDDSVCDDGSVSAEAADWSGPIPWQKLHQKRFEALAGQPRFIDFTADWCLTCKVNEATVLETDAVKQALAEHGYVPLKGDWTRRDPYITEWLVKYGRAGVPFYVVVPAHGDPIPLGETITQSQVLAALKQGAGK